MFTQMINEQLTRHGFRVSDKEALINQGRLKIQEDFCFGGKRLVIELDGREVFNRTIIDVTSIVYEVNYN